MFRDVKKFGTNIASSTRTIARMISAMLSRISLPSEMRGIRRGVEGGEGFDGTAGVGSTESVYCLTRRARPWRGEATRMADRGRVGSRRDSWPHMDPGDDRCEHPGRIVELEDVAPHIDAATPPSTTASASSSVADREPPSARTGTGQVEMTSASVSALPVCLVLIRSALVSLATRAWDLTGSTSRAPASRRRQARKISTFCRVCSSVPAPAGGVA
jgi:hypothetical protein